MIEKSTQKQRRARVPQRYYYAADILARVFRWRHIDAGRGTRWKLTFRVKALAKLAGLPVGEDARDTYLDALAALQARGELDSPEVKKHTDALHESAEGAERRHRERREREAATATRVIPRRSIIIARGPAPRLSVTATDYDGDPWDELRDEFERFLDEVEPDEEAGE